MDVFSSPSPDASALRATLRQRILTVTGDTFDALALAVFRYQAAYNAVYQQYIQHLGIVPERITDLRRVPFMPIDFFKRHTVTTGLITPAITFASSGTTGQRTGSTETSRHLVADTDLYDAVSRRIFEQTYGPLENFHILALLPSYLERNNSSLVYMVQRFMVHARNSDQSGFYLDNLDQLTDKLRYLIENPDGRRILLIGVTFGLLDWAESGRDFSFLSPQPNAVQPDLLVMETGGMKGRRRELLREEVHERLTQRLGVPMIHSEYGMTELLSQAYSAGEGVFIPGPTMRVFLRDINDPFEILPLPQTEADQTRSRQTGERRPDGPPMRSRQTGGMNVVDLANLDSCAFIETQDLGQYESLAGHRTTRAFRVIGRFDNSDVRGCNLMVL